MSGAQAENWFRELIKDKITVSAQAKGNYLEGMFMSGDEEAGTYKFPVIGRIEAVELSGSIEMVSANDADLSMISVTPKDYEASHWHRVQDLYKMGPSAQEALASLVAAAINRTKDQIKWDALYDFKPGAVDVGGNNEIISPQLIGRARSMVAAAGMFAGEDDVFLPIPERAMDQLFEFKAYASKDYVAPADAPFSRAARQSMINKRGVNIFTMPDEMFTWENDDADSDTNWFETFLWSKNAVGAETPWDGLPPSITQHTDRAGSPWLIKGGVGGCAVGIQQVGVKKLRFKGNRTPELELHRTKNEE